MRTYDDRHGGPFDRGGADYWYGRDCDPPSYKCNTSPTDRVEKADMSLAEINAYKAGYITARNNGDQKDWGE